MNNEAKNFFTVNVVTENGDFVIELTVDGKTMRLDVLGAYVIGGALVHTSNDLSTIDRFAKEREARERQFVPVMPPTPGRLS